MAEFKPYKDNEYLENPYYKIPQELFVSSLYKDKLNSDSKILYAFLLDRLSLSQKNHWIDEEKTILEDVIDSIYYKDNLKVGSVTVNHYKIKVGSVTVNHYKILDKLKLIVKENLIQLLDILKNIPNIQNAKNYLMILISIIKSVKMECPKNIPFL